MSTTSAFATASEFASWWCSIEYALTPNSSRCFSVDDWLFVLTETLVASKPEESKPDRMAQPIEPLPRIAMWLVFTAQV